MTLKGLEQTVLNSIKSLTNSATQQYYIKNGDGTSKRIQLGVKCVRYVYDFVILARSKNILIKYVMPKVNKFLKERGLWLSPDKTKIFKLSDKEPRAQLDFLGYIFKYSQKWSAKISMLLDKPGLGVIALLIYSHTKGVINLLNKCKEIFSKNMNSSAA